MNRIALVVALAACTKTESKPRPSPTPIAIDAAAIAPIAIDAAVDAGVSAVALPSLPEWEVPQVRGGGPPVVVYAADMDGPLLLAHFATQNLIQLSINKRVTGRMHAPSKQAAFAAIAKQLDIDLAKLPKLPGRGVTVDLLFSGASGTDLVRLLADVGRVDIVLVAELPKFDIMVHRVSWDAVLQTVLDLSGNEMIGKSPRYIVPKDTKLPPLPTLEQHEVLSIYVNDGTIGQALSAIRELVPDLPVGACEGKRFSLHLHPTPIAEVLRALSLASGAVLVRGKSCTSTKIGPGKIDDLRLTTIVTRGDKRAAAFDRGGAIVTGTRGDIIKEVGGTFVIFDGDDTLEIYAHADPPSDTYRRTAALVTEGDERTAYVETTDGFRLVDTRRDPWTDAKIQDDGVHDARGDVILFGK